MSKPRSIPDMTAIEAERIGIVKPSALGDVVQSLPLLPALRARFPRARLSWIVNGGLTDLLGGHPDLNEVIPFDRRGGWRAWRELLRTLRSRRFDVVFDLQGLFRTAVMTWATGAPLRIGLQTARECSHLACHALLPDTGKHVPAHVRYWRVAEALGVGHVERRTIVAVSRSDRQWAEERLLVDGPPLLAVQPGARWATKRWPAEKFAAVAAKAMRAFGFAVVLVGSRDERSVTEQVKRSLDRLHPGGTVLDLTGETSLKQLAAVLRRCDLMLSNDSGPMHLAAGLGTPTVGVFTCTSSVRSGPPGDHCALVATEVPCAASYRKRCPHRGSEHLACLEELGTRRVWTALESLVERTTAIRPAA